MCGICGVVALDERLDPTVKAAMPRMIGALWHRGPDGNGIFADDRAALGHARLAIIDRAGGAQPMGNEDGSVQVVFNGEIYNHRAVRRVLEARGHRFRSASDTEVIVHAFEEFGERCVERLEGMFAFAVYDAGRREVLLARDRLGKKPLFWAVLDGALHFGSEIKAIAESPAWNGDLNPAVLEEYLTLGYILAPRTIYKHVRKLEPGHLLHVAGGGVSIRKYWDVDAFDTDTRSEAAIVDAIDESLRSAVAERLESEVPLGAFLSGGIDSGLVVSYIAETSADRLQTTTVGFSDSAHNELAAAKITADTFGTTHHEAVIEPKLVDVLDPIVRGFDEPFADASAVPTYYLSQIARRHVTVALSGDGGDEAFGGYDFRYVPHAIEDRMRTAADAVGARASLGAIGAFWPRSRRLPRVLRAGSVLENIARDAATGYFVDLSFIKPADTRRLLGEDPSRDPRESSVYAAVTDAYRRCPSTSPVQRAQYADLKIYLPNDVLVKVDRMSMQHSLEIRCPLLDRRIVELAFSVPSRRKWSIRESKYLLRRLAARRLPAALGRMPKRGFSAPIGRWIASTHADAFRGEVLGSESAVRSLLDIDVVSRMFDDHRAGRRDWSQALWTVWMLERWSRTRPRGAGYTRESARLTPSRTLISR